MAFDDQPFRRREDGTIEVRLSTQEREMLATVASQLRELLLDGRDDALRRLFPPAYANDPEAEAEYRSLVHDDLLRKRLDDLELLEDTVTRTDLSPEQGEQWMHTLNGLRLVLGTRLDVSEDDEPLPVEHPAAGAHALYEYLGYLLERLLAA